jgi:hypothetical protein
MYLHLYSFQIKMGIKNVEIGTNEVSLLEAPGLAATSPAQW